MDNHVLEGAIEHGNDDLQHRTSPCEKRCELLRPRSRYDVVGSARKRLARGAATPEIDLSDLFTTETYSVFEDSATPMADVASTLDRITCTLSLTRACFSAVPFTSRTWGHCWWTEKDSLVEVDSSSLTCRMQGTSTPRPTNFVGRGCRRCNPGDRSGLLCLPLPGPTRASPSSCGSGDPAGGVCTRKFPRHRCLRRERRAAGHTCHSATPGHVAHRGRCVPSRR